MNWKQFCRDHSVAYFVGWFHINRYTTRPAVPRACFFLFFLGNIIVVTALAYSSTRHERPFKIIVVWNRVGVCVCVRARARSQCFVLVFWVFRVQYVDFCFDWGGVFCYCTCMFRFRVQNQLKFGNVVCTITVLLICSLLYCPLFCLSWNFPLFCTALPHRTHLFYSPTPFAYSLSFRQPIYPLFPFSLYLLKV